MDSTSSGAATLAKEIEDLDDFDPDLSENVSDLLAGMTGSSSLRLSSHDSDEHLLDFLNDRTIDISVSSKRKGMSFLSDGSPGYESRHSSSDIGGDSDASAFLIAFNSKFDVTATNLFDVLDLVDSLIAKKASPPRRSLANVSGMERLKESNVKLHNEKAELSNDLARMQSKLESTEQELANIRNENGGLSSNNASLCSENHGLQRTLVSLNELMEGHMGEMIELGEQRSQLIELTRKQSLVIEEFEKHCRTTAPALKPRCEAPAPLRKLETDRVDEFYTLMSSAVRLSDETLPRALTEKVHAIRDDSAVPVRERILLVIKYIASEVAALNKEIGESNKATEVLSVSASSYQRKCREVLSVVEEELVFMQTLTHSVDLQAAVFKTRGCDAPLILDEECKGQLIRRCATIGRFIEETLGAIAEDGKWSVPNEIDTTRVFDLLQVAAFDEKLKTLSARFSPSTDVDAREAFDLLLAQVFINDILRNHASELHMRMAHCAGEMERLRHEISERGDDSVEVAEMKKLVRHLRRRENKLRRYIGKFVDVRDDMTLVEMAQHFATVLHGQTDDSSESEPSPEKVKRSSKRRASPDREKQHSKERIHEKRSDKRAVEELQKKDAEINAVREDLQREQDAHRADAERCKVSFDNQTRDLQNQLDLIKNKLRDVIKQYEAKSKSTAKLQKVIDTKTEEINGLNAKLGEWQTSHEATTTELSGKLKTSQEEVARLSKQITEFETVLASVKKQRKALNSHIERLKTTNLRLTESSEAQLVKSREEYDAVVQTLTEEKEKLERDGASIASQCKIITAQNQQLSSENATLHIAKKSADLKLRAYDERLALEKRNLQSQVTAQVTAAQAGQTSQVTALANIIDLAVHKLTGLLPDTSASDSLDSAVAAITDEFDRMKKAQYVYIDLLDDVTETQKILGLSATSKLATVVRDIVERQATNERFAGERIPTTPSPDIERIRHELKKTEPQLVCLRQWESWGRRVHRLIHEAESLHLSSDQLRLALEEALLASVSHRSLYVRVESLRTQKSILKTSDKHVLQAKQPLRGITPVIAVCLFARRVQKLAGCLPMSMTRPHDITSDRSHRRSDDQGTPRKKQPSRGRSVCKRPLIPLYI